MHRLVAFVVAAFVFTAAAHAITINTVPVGNVGNAKDPATGGLYGGVSYAYNIGTTEVTNEQYTAFLTEKAKSDPLSLYNMLMGGDLRGGIARNGVSGSFTYSIRADMGNKPVNYVSWYDAIRFSNWLHNGQGAGDTETGAYTILGGTATPSNGPSIARNSGATWFLPSENEWYKAAYYQPAAQGGDNDNYWTYPTRNNGQPTVASAIDLSGPTRGDIGNPGTNVANYNSAAQWNGQNGNVTSVGSASLSSKSFYGTSDQGGNVYEWNETLISGPFRGLRGGSWGTAFNTLQASARDSDNPSNESAGYGFRVATVPGVAGDYNGNGIVDAADYVVWREGLGTTFTQNDYDVWRAHFGQTGGSGAGASSPAAVPESATWVMLMIAMAGWCLRRRPSA